MNDSLCAIIFELHVIKLRNRMIDRRVSQRPSQKKIPGKKPSCGLSCANWCAARRRRKNSSQPVSSGHGFRPRALRLSLRGCAEVRTPARRSSVVGSSARTGASRRSPFAVRRSVVGSSVRTCARDCFFFFFGAPGIEVPEWLPSIG
jgi:hypothetical protein